MTDKQVLKELLLKIESNISIFPRDFPTSFRAVPRAIGAYEGSLDAALALHNIQVPEWRWWVADALYWSFMDDDAPCVTLAKGTLATDLCVTTGHSEASTARAWLIAIIKVLIHETAD